MPAIEVNQTYRDEKVKSERIAFVKRVAESLLPQIMPRFKYLPNGDMAMEDAIQESERAYDTLKEWESKQ